MQCSVKGAGCNLPWLSHTAVQTAQDGDAAALQIEAASIDCGPALLNGEAAVQLTSHQLTQQPAVGC